MIGVMSVAAFLPNVLKLLPYFDKDFNKKSNPRYVANRAFWKLVREGYIVLRGTREGKMAQLTARGRNVLTVLDQPTVLKKPKRWDGKWRVLTFDIHEKRRSTRDHLRAALVCIGFARLQRSVWVYPYDCEDFIMLLKADYRISSEVIYMIVDRIENDQRLRDHFSLSTA